MKIFDLTSLYPYRPLHKCIIPSLITAGASIANMLLQKAENSRNRDFNSSEARKSRDYNTYLMRNSAQMHVQDARQAGLNPSFLNGSLLASNPSATAPASSSSSGIQPLDPMALSNVALMASQTRKNNADAQEKEIENKRKQVEDTTHNTTYFDPDTNVEINDLSSWLHDHPDKFPDMVRFAPHSEGATGRFNARKAQNEFRKEVSDTNASVVKNLLDEMVANQQLRDPMVVLSLSRMPSASFDKIVQVSKTLMNQAKYYDSASGKFDSEKALIDLESQLKKDNNIMPYIDKAFSGDFSLKDFAKVLMLGIMGAASRVSVRY